MNEIILLTITTSLGSFDIELYQKEAPITANNFVEYVEQNFYETTLFHRVIPGFVIQGGGFEIVISGEEVIDEIASVKTTNVGPYQDVPLEDVYIIKVEKK